MPSRHRDPSHRDSQRFGLANATLLLIILSVFSGLSLDARCRAEQPGQYADSVVEKAVSVLEEAGLRRSGKGLQAAESADLSRQLSALTRERRDLRLKQTEFESAEKQLETLSQNLSALNRTDRDLNLQLAQIAGTDVASNNRIVALINATRSQSVETRRLQQSQQETIRTLRGQLNEAEEAYSEKVFQTRRTLDGLNEKLKQSLSDPQVKIALTVMHRNFEVPIDIDSSQVLRSLHARLASFEKEVFQDSIDLQVGSSGSLFAMVSVNSQPIEMVVDSGATVITLPADTAIKLNLSIPNDAPVVNLSLANGQRITGRRIELDSVRVGEFEAKQVDAVVLEPIAGNAQPLLGLSYLDRYKFEVNPTAKTLGLLRVQTTP
ncbi:retropepsin-like aspartic protease family protein [Neorhodopirellula pilleata]|uniref:Retroviral aspartyl protease n=1 Tax=Neorhodopirellula pilleata TaxID=2714738 RepID=A0A5C6AUE8_9BACT|nr:retropepsin-like aspartic protease [Neorhodopirellula pilleata]TWU03633.1 hypothetical protein Pla100_05620 [Neorhodopirellula pilleata]